MKLGKYILGLALIAAGLTSCDQENLGAIYEPKVANITFMNSSQSSLTDQATIEVPVALSRAITNGEYTANITFSGSEGMSLKSNQVTFAPGEGIAYATVVVNGMTPGNEYKGKLTLSDADAATANTEFGAQITSATVTVMCDYNWVSAGTCTFVDGWYTNMFSADNVPVKHAEGTNIYRLVSPLYYVYKDVDPDQTCKDDFEFVLNSDGTISVAEGAWDLYYVDGGDKYYGYFTADYPSYCFTASNDGVHEVNFLFLNGSDLYGGGYFAFSFN
jgi:hypothetical protein